MKIILRFFALLLAGTMLFMGLETLLPQFPNLVSKSTAIVFIIVSIFFGSYGITGRSSMLKKEK